MRSKMINMVVLLSGELVCWLLVRPVKSAAVTQKEVVSFRWMRVLQDMWRLSHRLVSRQSGGDGGLSQETSLL